MTSASGARLSEAVLLDIAQRLGDAAVADVLQALGKTAKPLAYQRHLIANIMAVPYWDNPPAAFRADAERWLAETRPNGDEPTAP